MNSDIRRILNKKTHRVLDKINRELLDIELKAPEVFKETGALLTDLVAAFIILSIFLSMWSIPVIMAFAVLLYFCIKQVRFDLMKLSILGNFIDRKIDDLNFSLLSVIGSYRAANTLEQLGTKHQTLLNNQSKTRAVKQMNFVKTMQFTFEIIAQLYLFALITILVVCLSSSHFNWLGFSQPIIIWQALVISRGYYSLENLQ